MSILKKENWWIWLILYLVSSGVSMFVLGALLGVFKKDAWYANWRYWLIGFLALFLPFYIMLMVFMVQILTLTAAKLNVSGSEIYLSPYIWIMCLIVPIIGWMMIPIMLIYLQIMILVALYNGEAEQYIK